MGSFTQPYTDPLFPCGWEGAQVTDFPKMRQTDWPFCYIIILKLYNLNCFVPLPSLDSCLDSFDWTTESESINENSASFFNLFCMEASNDEDNLACMLLTQPRCSDWWQHPAVSARPSNRPRLPRAWPPLEETPHETIPRLHKRKDEMRSIEVIHQQARLLAPDKKGAQKTVLLWTLKQCRVEHSFLSLMIKFYLVPPPTPTHRGRDKKLLESGGKVQILSIDSG